MDFIDQHPLLKPVQVLDTRTILLQGQPRPQALIQWEHQPASAVTWESLTDLHQDFPDFCLEVKASHDGRGIDARKPRTRRSTKVGKYADFVTT